MTDDLQSTTCLWLQLILSDTGRPGLTVWWPPFGYVYGSWTSVCGQTEQSEEQKRGETVIFSLQHPSVLDIITDWQLVPTRKKGTVPKFL